MEERNRLTGIRKHLYEEVYGGHDLLRRYGVPDLGRLMLAELALCASKAGMPALDRLETIGVSLELIRLAVSRHYESTSPDGKFDLITADYYYARAISLASNIPSPRAVSSLSKAVVEIASAEASFSAKVNWEIGEARNRAGLFAAAGELGGHAAGLDEARIKVLSEFARQIGVAYLGVSGALPGPLVEKLGQVDFLIQEAASFIDGEIESSATAALVEFARSILNGGNNARDCKGLVCADAQDLALRTD